MRTNKHLKYFINHNKQEEEQTTTSETNNRLKVQTKKIENLNVLQDYFRAMTQVKKRQEKYL